MDVQQQAVKRKHLEDSSTHESENKYGKLSVEVLARQFLPQQNVEWVVPRGREHLEHDAVLLRTTFYYWSSSFTYSLIGLYVLYQADLIEKRFNGSWSWRLEAFSLILQGILSYINDVHCFGAKFPLSVRKYFPRFPRTHLAYLKLRRACFRVGPAFAKRKEPRAPRHEKSTLADKIRLADITHACMLAILQPLKIFTVPFDVVQILLLVIGCSCGFFCICQSKLARKAGDIKRYMVWHTLWHYSLPLAAFLMLQYSLWPSLGVSSIYGADLASGWRSL